MARCRRHRAVLHYGWHTTDGYWYESPYLARYQSDAAICQDCGTWFPLGPANDSIPKPEMRLAEMLVEIWMLWEPGQSREEAIQIAVDDCAEWCV